MASTSHAPLPLIDPVGIAEDAADGRTTAAAITSIGREVEFWLEEDGNIFVLRTSNLETPDPYGGHPIRSSPEVVCSDKGLVLLRLRSPHRNFPTDYFVYGHDAGGSKASPWASLLPEVLPEITSARSVGLLRSDDRYVVANLRLQPNTETGRLDAFLDCFAPWIKEEWSQRQVTLPFPDEDMMFEWQADQVIPLGDSLLWVDLWRGILLCPNLLSSDQGAATFEYVPLPSELLPAEASEDGHDLRQRPEPFRSAACCNGELKLVNILHGTSRSTVDITVAVGTLKTSLDGQWSWTVEKSRGPLDYHKLKDDRSKPLPSWEVNRPCFPVMSTDTADILYLTSARENEAWLLQVDMRNLRVLAKTDYSHFCHHRNPPQPIDLPRRPNSCREAAEDDWQVVWKQKVPSSWKPKVPSSWKPKVPSSLKHMVSYLLK